MALDAAAPSDALGGVHQELDLSVHRVCALDLGKARVGVALSDELGLLAHPRAPFDGRNRKALLRAIAELAREESVALFLVGLPLDMTGEAGSAARKAEVFAQEVANATGCNVQLLDERLTTVEAEARFRAQGLARHEMRSRIDGAAAAVLLQGWLDARASRTARTARSAKR